MLRSIERMMRSGEILRARDSKTTNRIMISGPQVSTQVLAAFKPQAIEQDGDDADIAAPVAIADIDGGFDRDIGLAPGLVFWRVEHVVGGARAIEQEDAAVVGAVLDDVVDGRAQGGQADAAAGNDEVEPFQASMGQDEP